MPNQSTIDDRLHENLIETGKQSRRLTWIVFIVSIFFIYLSLSYGDQPHRFKIGFLGNLEINKIDLILCAPLIIAALNLALSITLIYAASLHAQMIKQMTSRTATDTSEIGRLSYLQYPSFENFITALAADSMFLPMSRKLLTVVAITYRLIIRGLPLCAQFYLLWKGLKFSPTLTWSLILCFSVVPLVLGIAISLTNYHSIVVSFASKLSAEISQHALILNVKRGMVLILIGIVASVSFSFVYVQLIRSPLIVYSLSVADFSKSVGKDQLTLWYGDQEIKGLKTVTLDISNKGSKAIRDVQMLFFTPGGGRILSLEAKQWENVPLAQLSKEGSAAITMKVLNPGESFIVNLIVTDLTDKIHFTEQIKGKKRKIILDLKESESRFEIA